MSMAPNSFSMMAMRFPCFLSDRMWFSSVVLPLPRKPVMTWRGQEPASKCTVA